MLPRRLDDDQITALAAARRQGAPLSDDERRVLVERSDGLPLLVEELLDGLTSSRDGGDLPMPPTLAALVQRRLAELTATQVDAVRAAAVLGDVSDWTALRAVADQDEQDVLDALRDATCSPSTAPGACGGATR